MLRLKMPAMAARRGCFLPDPPAIRRALADGLSAATRLDMAVAFVGRDWADILGTFEGDVRLICWLSSTNTNPRAIEQMIARGADVRQMNGMHAKVYLTDGASAVAVIGSANLSGAALAADDALGQGEAAVRIDHPSSIVAEVRRWFEQLWSTAAMPIEPSDLDAAKRAWDAAHATARRPPGPRNGGSNTATLLPVDWEPSRELRQLANRGRSIDPARELQDERRFLARLEHQGVTRPTLKRVIEELSRWTGHAGAYYPSLQEPEARIKSAFATIFDQALPVSERLSLLAPNGDRKLAGFGLTAWTILLSWRHPREYPPFNRRTQRFLGDFGLAGRLRTSLSPQQYAEWVGFAQDLSSRLGLRSAGHIDRLVWLHTRDLTL